MTGNPFLYLHKIVIFLIYESTNVEMNELVKVFNGIKIPIEVENENIWFDVSNINKEQKVNFSNWKNSKQTKKLLSYNNSILNLNRPLIDDEVLGKNFIHKKMFISYARFVSVEFESKADDIVFDVITGNHQTQLDFSESQIKEFENKISLKDNQLKESIKKIEIATKNRIGYERDGNYQTLSKIKQSYKIDTPIDKLYQILVNKNIVIKKLVTRYDYLPNDSLVKSDNGQVLFHEDSLINLLDELGISRENGYCDKNPTLFDVEG